MAMSDPTEMGLDESQEPKVVKPGEEYKLVIVSVHEGEDKNGLDYLMPKVEIVGEPFSKDFSHFLHIPSRKNMTEKELNKARFAYDSFCKAFAIDNTRPHDPNDEWPGHEGYAILGAGDNEEYGEQNFIKKLVLPK